MKNTSEKIEMTAIRNHTLAKEIAIVLVVKFCLIFALWYAFFRDPIDRALTDRSVATAILGQATDAQRASHHPTDGT